MAILDLYSKRKRRERGETSDVYSYDEIPQGLRVQIVHIWGDALGNPTKTYDSTGRMNATYQFIVETLRREYQVFQLTKRTPNPNDDRYAYEELVEFFLAEKDTEKVLDVIELTAMAIDSATREYSYQQKRNADEIADAAIEELNNRFKENAVGYFCSDGKIVRVDSELIHSEVVKPVLSVLRQRGFENAQKEFLQAHEHFRAGNKAETLVECYKAFESTMKIICDRRGWPVDRSKGAADLVRVVLEKGLIPQYWQSHFAGLRSVLESAIPTPRNKQAGHGAGTSPLANVPEPLVAYVLHMTAATILFLTEADRTLP